MDFTKPWAFGDGIFILEDQKIYVSKAVLALSSEVFKTMFTADFAEKMMTVVPLREKSVDDFVVLMQAVHPPHTALADTQIGNNVECLLPLAHEYQMQHVISNCEKYLLTQPASIHNLILADKFSLTQLRTVCIEYIKDIPLKELDEHQEFKTLGSESLAEIYRSKLNLKEDTEPSKKVLYTLMAQPPSIENLFLAEKYDVPETKEKCLNYLKDTPLTQLQAETGFTDIKPDILIGVLKYKVEMLEPLRPLKTLQSEVKKITSWEKLDKTDQCIGTSVTEHSKGYASNCTECYKVRFDEIRKIMKKY